MPIDLSKFTKPRKKDNFSFAGKENYSSESFSRAKISLGVREVIAIVVLVMIVLSTLFIYIVDYYIDGQIDQIGQEIINRDENIQLATIRELTSFDKQIRIMKDLRGTTGVHIPILTEFSKIVVNGVRYESLNIRMTESQQFLVKIKASTNSFFTYIQQLKVLENVEGVLSGLKVSDYVVSRGDETTVSFDIELVVSPSKISEFFNINI